MFEKLPLLWQMSLWIYIDILMLNKSLSFFLALMVLEEMMKLEVAKLNFSGKRGSQAVSRYFTNKSTLSAPSFKHLAY